MNPQATIKKGEGGRYWWVIRGSNGKTFCASTRSYQTEAACRDALQDFYSDVSTLISQHLKKTG